MNFIFYNITNITQSVFQSLAWISTPFNWDYVRLLDGKICGTKLMLV